MNLDELMMLNDDQIDYDSLADSLLKDLAFGNDLFVANSALASLSKRKSKLASAVARDILEKKIGDPLLQAASINVLFDAKPPEAIEFIEKEIEFCDLHILNTVLELMNDNFNYFNSSSFSNLVRTVFKRLSELDPAVKWPDSEVSETFFRLYGNLNLKQW